MPKVVSSARAMTVRFLSATIAWLRKAKTRCLATSGVTMKRGRPAMTFRIVGRAH